MNQPPYPPPQAPHPQAPYAGQAPMHQAPQHQAPMHQAPQHQAPMHQAPAQPAQTEAKAPAWAFLFALLACGVGFLTFLIAGFRGHSAGWEMMAVPALATFGLAGIGFIGAIVAGVRRRLGVAAALVGMTGFASLLAVVGFVLGA